MVKGDHMVKANIPVLFGWKEPEWGEGKTYKCITNKYKYTNTEVQKLTEVKCLALQGGNQEKEEGKTHSNLVSHRLFWKRLQILMPSFKCVVDIVDSKKVF